MQFRVVTNGHYFRAQVRTFLFWWDIDGDGYSSWAPYEVAYENTARGFIRKFQERIEQRGLRSGPWRVTRPCKESQ